MHKTATLTSPGEVLLESDAYYFQLAAERLALSRGDLFYVSDLIELPVSCVAVVAGAELAASQAASFTHELESECHALGARLARCYVQHAADDLVTAMSRFGYHAKVEAGFLIAPHLAAPAARDVALRPVVTSRDWDDKLAVHQLEDIGSDGYRNQALDWNELMRRKNAAGCKKSFLIEVAGNVAGAIAVVEMPGLLRLKNLFVLPAFRGRGVAEAAVRAVLAQAVELGVAIVGVFGIAGSTGYALYERCGFRAVNHQTEFTRPLEMRSRAARPRQPR